MNILRLIFPKRGSSLKEAQAGLQPYPPPGTKNPAVERWADAERQEVPPDFEPSDDPPSGSSAPDNWNGGAL